MDAERHFTPEFPRQGDIVEVPLTDPLTGKNWIVLSIPTGTTEPRSAAFAMESNGIPYAELRVIGVQIEVATAGPHFQGFVRLAKFNADGTIPLIYGAQIGQIRQSAGAGAEQLPANTDERNTITGYRRLNVIQLRDNPKLNLTQKIQAEGAVVNVRDNVGAPPFNGLPTQILLTMTARCEALSDFGVEARAVGRMLEQLPGRGGIPEKFTRLIRDAEFGRRARAQQRKQRRKR